MASNDAWLKAVFKRYMVPARISLFTVNTIVAGHCLGADALSVLSLTSPIYLLFVVAGAWINLGAFTKVMASIGENQPEKARSYSTLALLWTALFSAVGSILLFAFWQPLLTLLGVPDALREAASSYGWILAAGGFFFAFLHYPFHFLKIAGLQRYDMALLLAMSAFDAAFALLFLFVFDMGIRAVAWASVLAMALTGLWGFVILRRAHGRFLFGAVRDFRASSLELFRAGSAVALGKAYSVAQILLLNWILLDAMGANGLAVFAVVLSALNICHVLVSIVLQPVTPLASLFYGQRDRASLLATLRISLQKGALFGVLPTALLGIFSAQAAALNGIQPALLPAAASALKWLAAAAIPMALNAVLIAYLLAIEKTALANGLAFLRGLLLVVCYTAFAAYSGGTPVWANYAFAEWTALLLLVIVQRVWPKGAGMTEAALEPPTGLCGETAFSVAYAPATVDGWAKDVADFCAAQQVERQVSARLSSFMEKMTPQIFAHCFPTEKKGTVEARILVFSDRVVLRLCSMGKLFDPADAHSGISALAETQPAALVFKRALGVNQFFLTLERTPAKAFSAER